MKIICKSATGEEVHRTDLKDVVVGRDSPTSDADVRIKGDSCVSRRHFRIWVEDEKLWLEDLGSTGGTRVNGEQVKERLLITAQDKIQVEDSILSVSVAWNPPRPMPVEGQDTDATVILTPKSLLPDD